MGEYAIRKADGERIKIGTCQSMYYLRFDQRKQVEYGKGNYIMKQNIQDFWFRLPQIEEKDIKPGEFAYYGLDGAEPIPFKVEDNCCLYDYIETALEKKAKEPGHVQLKVPYAGILAEIPCAHGIPLSGEICDGNGYLSMGYNGFEFDTLCLSAVGVSYDDIYGRWKAYGRIRCRICEEPLFAFSYEDIAEYCRPYAYYGYQGDVEDDWNLVMNYMAKMEKVAANWKKPDVSQPW